jgi:hypothetical protein
MADTQIDISGFDNEGIVRQYQLKSGDATSSVAYDLSGAAFEAQIRDQKSALVLALTTDNGGIVITDAPNGIFQIRIARGAIMFQANRSLRYDLLLEVGDSFRRLWGGNVRISAGTTQPT